MGVVHRDLGLGVAVGCPSFGGCGLGVRLDVTLGTATASGVVARLVAGVGMGLSSVRRCRARGNRCVPVAATGPEVGAGDGAVPVGIHKRGRVGVGIEVAV